MIQIKIRVDTILIFGYEAIYIVIDINDCFRHYSCLIDLRIDSCDARSFCSAQI